MKQREQRVKTSENKTREKKREKHVRQKREKNVTRSLHMASCGLHMAWKLLMTHPGATLDDTPRL